jgi:hypothetical protein
VVSAVEAAGIGVDEIAPRRPTLDDRFWPSPATAPKLRSQKHRWRSGDRDHRHANPPGRPGPLPARHRAVDRAQPVCDPRVPERLLDVTIQPVVFILLFLYVFGSAIHVPGISYKNYLFPGIIGQSLAFGIIGAGVATSNDVTEGVRSMPINRLSIIGGQVMGQFCEQVLGLVITTGIPRPDQLRKVAHVRQAQHQKA